MGGFSKEVILNNEWLKSYYDEIEQSSKRLINQEMPNLTYQLFSQYFKSGNRLGYEKSYFLRREYLTTFTLMTLIEGEEKYLKKLEDVMFSICDEYTWALPAHIGESEWNEETRFVLDLFACETAAALAEVITMIGNQLSSTVIKRAKQEVLNRVIYPFLNRTNPYSFEAYQNNWCAVCGGSIGIASLYLLEDKQQLKQIIKDVDLIMDHYLASFEDDGVCLEGLSYWTYGMSYYVAYFELVQRKIPQLKSIDEKLENIIRFQDKCYFEKGLTVSFSDGSRHDLFRIGLTHYLAHQVSGVKLPNRTGGMGYHSDHCYRLIPTIRDFSWTLDYPSKVSESHTASSHAFPSAQWLICKSQNGAGVAIKGGHNDEPHNHNDVGAFSYNYRGVDLITDLGAGEYTRDYFNENRYTIFCNQSLSHSVPIINKSEQKNGPTYRANHCILNNEFEMILEISNAYDVDELTSLYRNIKMDQHDGTLMLKDEFLFNQTNQTIIERFVTSIPPQVEQNEVLLKDGNILGRIRLENHRITPVVTLYHHQNHQGECEKVYTIDYILEVMNQKICCEFIMSVEEVGGM